MINILFKQEVRILYAFLVYAAFTVCGMERRALFVSFFPEAWAIRCLSSRAFPS
jgi:hypothetical protein